MSDFAGTAVGHKAEKMLGFGGTKTGILLPQKEGWLMKKPFTGRSSGAWQKRYFVLKDSFLFWYDKKVEGVPFSIYPKGVLPVGGAQAFPMGRQGNDFLFEVTHADFSHAMVLKSHDKVDVDDWIQVLTDCRKATYSNAILGNALLERMKSVGTAMEKEKAQALEAAQAHAAELEATRQQKWQNMKEHMDQQREHDLALNEQLGETQKLAGQMEEMAKKVEEQRLAKLTEKELADEAKAQLTVAREHVEKLAAALKLKQAAIDKDAQLATKIREAMLTIEKFFSRDENV